MLDKAPVLQLEAQRLEKELESRVGHIALSRKEASHELSIPQEVISEVESIRYGELVIAALQIKGRAENQSRLMKNMGYEYPQKGRKNNIVMAVGRLHELGMVEMEEDEKSNRMSKGAIDITELGRTYEVNPETIEKIKTNSDDQSI